MGGLGRKAQGGDRVKYTQIQRNLIDMITIGEYIQHSQPRAYQSLYLRFKLYIRDITEQILAAADVSGADKQYQHIMRERPLSGRGGLLPGEGDDVI